MISQLLLQAGIYEKGCLRDYKHHINGDLVVGHLHLAFTPLRCMHEGRGPTKYQLNLPTKVLQAA